MLAAQILLSLPDSNSLDRLFVEKRERRKKRERRERRKSSLKVIQGGSTLTLFQRLKEERSSLLVANLQKINQKLFVISCLSFLCSGFLYFIASSLETQLLKKLEIVAHQLESSEDLKSELSKSYNLSLF